MQSLKQFDEWKIVEKLGDRVSSHLSRIRTEVEMALASYPDLVKQLTIPRVKNKPKHLEITGISVIREDKRGSHVISQVA